MFARKSWGALAALSMSLLSLLSLWMGAPAPAAAATQVTPLPALDLPPAKPGEQRTLVLASGCFWCVEAMFESLEGVIDVTSGYAGGTAETATYEQVSSGRTGHAESVRITYDASKITMAQLLQVFFTMHDPTTLDRAGPDHGHQYRSAIFPDGPEQRKVAEAYIEQLKTARIYFDPIVTTIEPLTTFYPAEAYHQDYVKRHPDQPYVRQESIPKLMRLRELFPKLLKR
jgi:peptide-methionine (S)-S-oxide reductase